jgi:hypothetical protein
VEIEIGNEAFVMQSAVVEDAFCDSNCFIVICSFLNSSTVIILYISLLGN